MSDQSTPTWHAKPGCPRHLIAVLERAVNALPSEWLLPPRTGEIFDSIEHCRRRLQGYSLAEGFEVVQTGGGTKQNSAARFECSKYGEITRNWRKLEPRVECNKNSNITSKCQVKGTLVSQTGCKWGVRISWKNIGKRGFSNKAFIITVTLIDYKGHPLVDNPLSIPTHLRNLEEYQSMISTVRKHRQAVIPYSESRRVFECEEFGIHITARQYYDSIRKITPDKNKPETVNGLLIALQEADFVYRVRIEIKEDKKGKPISHKIKQIWFAHKE